MTQVDNAFRDNFNFPEAMRIIFDLLKFTNKYMAKAPSPKVLLLNKAADFMNNVFKVLGVVGDDETHFLGSRQLEMENELTPILNLICQARAEIIGIFRQFKQGQEVTLDNAKELVERFQ